MGAVKARTLLLLFLLSWGPIAFLAAVVLDSSGLFWASVGWTAMLGLPWSWWSASALPELSSVGVCGAADALCPVECRLDRCSCCGG